MSKHFFDFNKPIMDNRDEIMLVKLTGCLKNATESLVLSALANGYEKWRLKYPGIESNFLNKVSQAGKDGPVVAFRISALYTPKKFLVEMRKPHPPLPDDEIDRDLALLMGGYLDPVHSSYTSLELGIREIAKYDFCKKIIIYEPAMNVHIADYLGHLFMGYVGKVYTMEGFLDEALEKNPDATTIFADDVEEVMKVMEYYEGTDNTEFLKDKQFFVQCMNAIEKYDENEKPVFKYQKYMEDAKERFGANVTWITSHYIDLSVPMPGTNGKELHPKE